MTHFAAIQIVKGVTASNYSDWYELYGNCLKLLRPYLLLHSINMGFHVKFCIGNVVLYISLLYQSFCRWRDSWFFACCFCFYVYVFVMGSNASTSLSDKSVCNCVFPGHLHYFGNHLLAGKRLAGCIAYFVRFCMLLYLLINNDTDSVGRCLMFV